MHAGAAESLLPFLGSNARVLDVGSGSGYLTHVLANLVGPGGTVIGIDHIPGLISLAQTNMEKSAEGRELLESGRVKFVKADGRLGYPPGEPYDAIHVGAAASTLHEDLVKQLKAPGRMFIPVDNEGGYGQSIWVVDKKEDGTVQKKREYGVSYVPLTDAPKD
jgi:protein-L-isoaspartate(D-aspartate) O-methyltransferase